MKKTAAPPQATPADSAGFETFKAELARLVGRFEQNFKLYQSPSYSEASVRQDFLDPLFAALGWDIGNKRGLIPQHREVEIESRTEISGRQKRADYLFRTDRTDRFVCEAKKPAEELHAAHAFQAKRYAWNKNLVLAVLSDFEEIKIYLVGARPHVDDPDTGHFQTWHYLEYAKHAADIWNLLSRDAVAAGAIEKLVAALPRKPVAKTKAKQQWLFKPDRARAIDADFLDFLDEARRELASDLIRHNDRADLLEGTRLDEAVQRILDRLLFLRICEDRDIDTGRPLANILKSWRDRAENPPPRKLRAPALPLHEAAAEYAAAAKPAPPESLWREIVAHFRALDRRPASHIPYFNGNLFKEHFSETLAVSDEWISGFLDEIGDDESPYLFNVIPVEILGTIYERFLGKTVRPHGRGVTIEEKPEVRKAGGVYYTPRYIVDYIVEQTVGKLLEGKSPLDSLKLRVLDPACGSGSFLIRAYERLCEHWQAALTRDEKLRRKTDCWTDPDTGDLHLTTDLKRRILTANIFGVDLDAGAVEVTQLSLYLKMLEGESRATLAKNRELFGPDTPLLPPLENNIKCGNSLIASDFSLNPDDLLRVRAFDWDEGFREIMKGGGFDAVIGNPPYIDSEWMSRYHPDERRYCAEKYTAASGNWDIFCVFIDRAVQLAKQNGLVSQIVPNKLGSAGYAAGARKTVSEMSSLISIRDYSHVRVFPVSVYPLVFVSQKTKSLPKAVNYERMREAEEQTPVIEFDASLDYHEYFSDTNRPWQIFASISKSNLASRLSKIFPRLDNCATVLGAATVSEAYEIAKLVTNGVQGLKLVNSGTIDRYHAMWGCKECRYLGNSYINPVISHAAQIRLPKKRLEQSKKSKIIIAGMTLRLECTLDLNGEFLAGKSTSIVFGSSDLRYILAILNSQVVNYFYSSVFGGNKLQGGYLRIGPPQLSQIPIPPIDLKNSAFLALHDKLVALVDKMLLLVPKLRAAKSEGDRATLQNAVSATDRAIDALVYELYGLTADEIALVESSTKA